MAEAICIVAAKGVKDTGRVSFRFKALAGLSYTESMAFPIYGLLSRQEKKPDEVNPWRLVRGEPGAIGPDGCRKWVVFLFDANGQCFSASVDEDKAQEEGFQSLLKEDMPDCALLVQDDILEALQQVCQSSDIKIQVHCYDGELPTS